MFSDQIQPTSPRHPLRGRVIFLTLLLLSGVQLPLLAQAPRSQRTAAQQAGKDDDFLTRSHLEASNQDLKEPSIFHQPKCKTPAEQLSYAQQSEARGATRRARKAYNALVHQWHNSPEAPLAQLALAKLRQKNGQRLKAFADYQYAIDYFSGHFEFEQVIDQQFRLANELRGELEKGWLGFGREAGVDEVAELFRIVARNAPGWKRTPECYLMIGMAFEAAKRYDEAVSPYETLATRYPRHELVETAMFNAAACRYQMACKRPRDEATLRHALSALTATRRDFPNHPQLEEITTRLVELGNRLTRMHYEQAAFYDKVRKEPAAAIAAYEDFLRRFPFANEAEQTKARIAQLKLLATETTSTTRPTETEDQP